MSQRNINKEIVVAIATGVVVIAPFTIMPLLVGAMVNELGLTVKQAGYVAASEMAGSGLAALFISIFIAGFNRRLIITGALGSFIVCNLTAAVIADLEMLLAIRFLTGISSGMAVATVSAIFAGSRVPARNFSFLFMGNLVFGMAGFLLLPLLILNQWGLGGIYNLLALLAVGMLLFSPAISKGSGVTHKNKGPRQSLLLKPKVIAGLAGSFIYFISVGVVWPFVEQLGVVRDLSRDHIGIVLSGTQIGGICGSLLAAWLATKHGPRKSIAVGASISLISLALFLLDSSLWVYALGAILFYFSFIFTLAYLEGVLSALDTTGRVVALSVTMKTAGLALGPAIAGEVIARNGYSGLIWFAAICLGFAIIPIMIAAATLATEKTNRPPLT